MKYCSHCGASISNFAVVCPKCGCSTKKLVVEENMRTNGFGIAGFIISLLSIFLGMYFCIVPIFGVIFSGIGVHNMKKRQTNGLAVAGLVISILSLIFWVIVLIDISYW